MKASSDTYERDHWVRLWRRAEEIRSLCGLSPLAVGAVGSPSGPEPVSLEPLVEALLRDLEVNFRRELATRVQLEGLAELVGFTAPGAPPGTSYRLLVNYLARALDEPNLWLGLVEGTPLVFSLYRREDPTLVQLQPERAQIQWLQPDWLRWVALGSGSAVLWTSPTGSRRGGPWHPIAVRGELPIDRLSGEVPHCPGSLAGAATCALSQQPIEAMAGGAPACASCAFRRVIGLLGIEGEEDHGRRTSLEALAPALGAILVNLELKEALDFEARFRDEVIDNLPLGVLAVDQRGRVLTWNHAAERILGVTRQAVRATSIARLIPERPWHEALRESLEQGVERSGAESGAVRPDGTTIPLEISCAPLRDAEGRIRGAVATLVDVSSLRSMEERIRQLDRLAALGRFASSVAHELRNPLTGIATGVEYLSRDLAEDDVRRQSVGFILREVVRLNRIIQDLFAAARPRSLRIAPVEPREVVERALRGLEPAPEAGGVRVVLKDPESWPAVTADSDQLQQVFLNLIQNAVQSTPSGGTVTIEIVRGEGGAEILVEDTGEGIPEENRGNLFDPFFTTRPKGTGLGLFVVHGIVQRHGGSIDVETEEGKGSLFRIFLPDPAA